MKTQKYGDFPTLEEIKKDYNELMEIIKNVNSIEGARNLENVQRLTIEINGMSIDEFVATDEYGFKSDDNDIDWIRVESYGCLSYIYKLKNGQVWFDVWCDYCQWEFITDITIDKLTEEFYENAKAETIHKFK